MFQQVIAKNMKFKRPEKAQRTQHFLANVQLLVDIKKIHLTGLIIAQFRLTSIGFDFTESDLVLDPLMRFQAVQTS